jgi:aldose 1-epimerase
MTKFSKSALTFKVSALSKISTISVILAVFLLSGCASEKPKTAGSPAKSVEPAFSVSELPIVVGGMPVILLSQPLLDKAKAQIIEVYILPGRGMNIYKIRGFLPGKGIVDLISSESFTEAQKLMSDTPTDTNGEMTEQDSSGKQSFLSGGAILVPWANRIRGQYDDTKKTIETHLVGGVSVSLPANWKGSEPTAINVAMNGLILNRKFTTTSSITADQASVTGLLQADNFEGHWPSKTDLAITATLSQTTFTLTVLAKNTGTEALPMGIGWYPYFSIPSGDRTQAHVRIPGLQRVSTRNLDDVLPNGKLVGTRDTRFDFTPLKGKALGTRGYDTCFTDLERDSIDQAVAELVDPAADYGVRIKAISDQIRAFQLYAPEEQQFAVIAPQFNLADPYGKEWDQATAQIPGQAPQPVHVDTGMQLLQPGETTQYVVVLELFKPKQ